MDLKEPKTKLLQTQSLHLKSESELRWTLKRTSSLRPAASFGHILKDSGIANTSEAGDRRKPQQGNTRAKEMVTIQSPISTPHLPLYQTSELPSSSSKQGHAKSPERRLIPVKYLNDMNGDVVTPALGLEPKSSEDEDIKLEGASNSSVNNFLSCVNLNQDIIGITKKKVTTPLAQGKKRSIREHKDSAWKSCLPGPRVKALMCPLNMRKKENRHVTQVNYPDWMLDLLQSMTSAAEIDKKLIVIYGLTALEPSQVDGLMLCEPFWQMVLAWMFHFLQKDMLLCLTELLGLVLKLVRQLGYNNFYDFTETCFKHAEWRSSTNVFVRSCKTYLAVIEETEQREAISRNFRVNNIPLPEDDHLAVMEEQDYMMGRPPVGHVVKLDNLVVVQPKSKHDIPRKAEKRVAAMSEELGRCIKRLKLEEFLTTDSEEEEQFEGLKCKKTRDRKVKFATSVQVRKFAWDAGERMRMFDKGKLLNIRITDLKKVPVRGRRVCLIRDSS